VIIAKAGSAVTGTHVTGFHRVAAAWRTDESGRFPFRQFTPVSALLRFEEVGFVIILRTISEASTKSEISMAWETRKQILAAEAAAGAAQQKETQKRDGNEAHG
jgi:hypothetical protein